MKTKQEVKRNIMRRIMELRTKDMIEEDIILDVLDDNLDSYIDDLCKENKSLLESCEGATMMYKDLCKTKELLKGIIDTPMYNQMGGEMYENEEYKELIAEAEQFLKGTEE